MKLYNQLTRQVEDFKPLKPEKVGVYSCGPTVYDHAHIGNLSAYIFADTLRRVLVAQQYAVKQVMNYTDVDDKTIRRSRETYPSEDPRQALYKLTDHYIKIFLEDMVRLGNDVDSFEFVRATDRIDAMRQLISELHNKGFAYIADDGVYFSIEAYRKSGKVYGQLTAITADSTSTARIQNDEYDKESIHDFALWKRQRDGEPAWEFTLDGQDLKGRPGWHIECSAMSREALGLPFDIHTGGVDLIFPHHENEIAQSTAGQGDPLMARFFTHNEHILVDRRKMAKSDRNFLTLEDVAQKGYEPLAFRLMILQSHYRSQLNFSWENLESAENRLKSYRAMADLRWQTQEGNDSVDNKGLLEARKAILAALGDDLNTPVALKELSQLENDAANRGVADTARQEFGRLLTDLDAWLGLSLAGREDINQQQKELLRQRLAAREKSDWNRSDEIRQQLHDQGVNIRDTDNGSIWSRL